MDFESKKKELLSSLHELKSLAQSNEVASSYTNIDREIRKLTEERFHLVVLGQFKRGKTTFINAVLGEQLLPVAVVPLTSVVTLIRYGEQNHIDIIFEKGERTTITQDKLPEYVTERGNPMNQKEVRYVEISHPSEFLKEGIVLIDTPGIGSMFLHNTTTTYDFIPNIDAAIFILSPDPPLTQAEYDFLEDVKKAVNHIFLVLNKVDLLSQAEVNEIATYINQIIQKNFFGNLPLFPISARTALEAKQQNNNEMLDKSQLPTLVHNVSSFLKDNKGMIMLEASKNRVINIVDEIGFNIELRLKAFQTPLIELEGKIREFNKEASVVKRDREEFNYLLQGRIKSVQNWIEEELYKFGDKLSVKLHKSVLQWLEPIKDFHDKDAIESVKQNAQKFMVEQFEQWRSEHEPELKRRYEQIIAEYAEKANGCVKKVLELSTRMFDVHVIPFSEITALEWKQTFTYKVGSEPLLFDIDTLQTFNRFLPSKLIKRKQFQRIRDELVHNVSQNCGRLSYEYRYSMQESHRMFQYELNEKLDQLLEEIETIFKKASERKETDNASVQGNINQLYEMLNKIELIRVQLKNKSSDKYVSESV